MGRDLLAPDRCSVIFAGMNDTTPLGTPRRDPTDFGDEYSRPPSATLRRIEREVFGHDVGTGYTTLAEAQVLATHLDVGPTARVLDIGAGRGWPGVEIMRATGCHLVCTDMPFNALVAARTSLMAAGGDGRFDLVVADGRALPFAPSTMDAVTHADVFC